MTERRNQVSGLCTNSKFLIALQKQRRPRYLHVTDDSFYVQRQGENGEHGWTSAARRKHDFKRMNFPQDIGKQHCVN